MSMTETDWLACCAHMEALWPQADLPEATIKAWWPLMSDLTQEAVTGALMRLRATPGQTWPPGPGDIRAQAVGLDADAAEARVSSVLAYGSRSLDMISDPVAREAVAALGGMMTLAASSDGWWRKDFRRAYESAGRRQVSSAAVLAARDSRGELTHG